LHPQSAPFPKPVFRALVKALDADGIPASGGIIGGMGGGGILDRAPVLAHELGHAEQQASKALSLKLRMPAMLAGGAAGGGVLLTKDRDRAKLYAGLGSAASLPILFNEYDASRRGAGLVKQLMPGASKSLRRLPYVGLPTYAALALSPWAAYAGKSAMGGYGGEKGWLGGSWK
jgi:hypothetical protein